MASGCMLLTMKTMCQNTCCIEKRPEPIQELSGIMFFKARSNFFFWNFKKKFVSPQALPSRWPYKIIFWSKKFGKKSCQSNSQKNFVKKKVNQGLCYWVWNLCDKILACLKKDPGCFRKHPEQCFLRPDINFFQNFWKNFNSA